MFKAVIFDMDGVIVDSEALSVASEKYVLNKYGIHIDESDWGTFKGKTSVAIFNFVIKKYSVKDLTAEQMREEKIKYYMDNFEKSISLFDGFLDLINYLRPKYKLALATSSGTDIQLKIFDKFQLDKYFDHIVTGNMVSNSKPHPEPYILAMNKLNLSASDCVVIEDADNGIESAKAAGIKVIAITHTFPKEKLVKADYIVDRLGDITKII